MTSFSSLLSSISGQPQVAQPRASTSAPRPPPRPSTSADLQSGSNGAKLTANNTAAGVKRKSEEAVLHPQSKVLRVESTGSLGKPAQRTASQSQPAPAGTNSNTPYRGTARSAGPADAPKVVARPAPKAGPVSLASSVSAKPASVNVTDKPKRGFAALMEKAKASQEASKLAATSGIKHKTMEKLNRKDREKMQKEVAVQQRVGKKAGGTATKDRMLGATPTDGKPALAKKPLETSYKGTMRKAAPEPTYKGTMRPAGTGQASAKSALKKGQGQDRYGGYASWSDLDDVEDDEEDYESDASSDMEGGFDDVEREETAALRAARLEDQQALAEEERHRREKLERKRRLEALSKNAAARRK